MKRSKFKHEKHRRLAFRNRQAALSTILRQLGAIHDDAGYLRVIALLGLGGAGKSRLLDEITTRASELYPDIKFIRISLEAESVGMAVAPLKAIRDRLDFDCLLFDCAIVSYWATMGQAFHLVEGSALSRSFVVRAIEAVADVTGLALPLSFAADIYDRAMRRIRRKYLYDKADFEQIDRLRDSPSEILTRLPYYLGQDINKHLGTNGKHISFLYDSYEKQSIRALRTQSEWLREFIGALDCGVHIVASRESLRWPDASWCDVLTEIVVDALPEYDCREILQNETGAPDDAINKMVAVSHCIPFFVEACINAYQTLKLDHDIVYISTLPGTQAEATSFLIQHLAPAEREIIVTLATLQFFDEIQFRLLVRALNIPLAFSTFDDIRSLFLSNRTMGKMAFIRHTISYRHSCVVS